MQPDTVERTGTARNETLLCLMPLILTIKRYYNIPDIRSLHVKALASSAGAGGSPPRSRSHSGKTLVLRPTWGFEFWVWVGLGV